MKNNFEADLFKWRETQERRLRSEDGWLTVVGLHWLSEGDNFLGSSEKASARLPESVPVKLGRINKQGSNIIMTFDSAEGVLLDKKVIEVGAPYELRDDSAVGGATHVTIGSVTFFLIKRSNGFGIRVKDTASEVRKNFGGRRWFPPDEKYIVRAKWNELKTPKKLQVSDVIGNTVEEDSPGFAFFEIEGQNNSLYPTLQDGKLFFVFKDKTNGKETYGAGRFLYSNLPDNNEVILDFNRAVNPPCVFTEYATCPLPPPENRLPVAIEAGELTPQNHG